MSSELTRKSPIVRKNGIATWTACEGDRYVATGLDVNGKRFRIESASFSHIRGINLFRGNKWLLREGHKHLILSVIN